MPTSFGRIGFSCVLLAGLASPSGADFYFNGPKNQTWFVVSPQVGGAYDPHGGPVFGATASFYGAPTGGPGLGVGTYAYGGTFQAEVLAKVSILGLAGGSAGLAVHDGKPGFTGDLWASAVFVGLRYKGTQTTEGTSHAWMVFFPLWYLDMK